LGGAIVAMVKMSLDIFFIRAKREETGVNM
jgi:hypothetical protein